MSETYIRIRYSLLVRAPTWESWVQVPVPDETKWGFTLCSPTCVEAAYRLISGDIHVSQPPKFLVHPLLSFVGLGAQSTRTESSPAGKIGRGTPSLRILPGL